jgi:large repetitive protein
MRRIPLFGLAALLVLAAGAAALAETGPEAEVIHACKHPAGGWLRIVSGPDGCRRREVPVSWNVAGPKGDKGDPGEPGPAGPAGPKGDPGTVVAGLETLDGGPCTASDGAAGEIDVTIAANGNVTLRCIADDEPPPPPPGPARLVINEVDYDQVGADSEGFVEIHNTGAEVADLSGIALVAVNGGDGTEYDRVALTGTLDPGGYLAVAIELQNGAPDGIALFDTAANVLVDALSYEGAITAATIGGQTFSLVEGTALPDTVADSNTVAGSLIRNPDGRDTNDAASDWAFTTTLTRGAPNVLTS